MTNGNVLVMELPPTHCWLRSRTFLFVFPQGAGEAVGEAKVVLHTFGRWNMTPKNECTVHCPRPGSLRVTQLEVKRRKQSSCLLQLEPRRMRKGRPLTFP